ncbi:hypothetical protein L9F63_006758 [Diploptera punctata]|uniref:Histone deacetylase 8 n=1 Tax=Diploptera punctata TaxID=6984 RepID=A0AAD8E4K3_DIPPU|nr:hypothetical protein L9F63_006758 [Diploptera punctata]
MDCSEYSAKTVVYVYNNQLLKECEKIPNIYGRAYLVHNLIKSYGLLSDMQIKPPVPATEDDLTSFHSRDYIHFLQKMDECNDWEKFEEEQLEFGLSYDCPMIEGIYNFAQIIAGASLTAARVLVEDLATVAINWCGGWHHAQRDEAEGFCYINDAVLAIHKLRERFQRVLYIDLDLHHGNGVENAFAYTPHVLTFSLHKHELGFILFHPDAVVVQCGADGVNGDPTSGFNLTPQGLGMCVQSVLLWGVPTLFLGGGGYNLPNTSRCWTYLTSVILGQTINSSIPDINDDFIRYSPDFELDVMPGNRTDLNTDDYLEQVVNTILKNLDNIFVSS